MEHLARRNLLKMMFGVGAAAACGLSLTAPAEAKDVPPAGTADASAAASKTEEVVESALEPNQFYFVRRRRFRRRVFFVRPRRRVVYVARRRPRRFYRVVRVRRFRRW